MKAETAGSKTHKGTKANHPLGRLVNVTNGLEIKRVRHAVAQEMVNAGKGWNFCPKKFVLAA